MGSQLRHRIKLLVVLLFSQLSQRGFGQAAGPGYHMEYTKSHRTSFTQTWNYHFPNFSSTRWFIALRYEPATAWSRDVRCSAALRTSAGWKPFKVVRNKDAKPKVICPIDAERCF